MDENNLRNPYFKQLKRGKLGMFEEIYLRYCGKRDYKRGVVRKDENNQYMSPFIEQEKNILGVAIRKEEEILKRTIVASQIGISIVESQKEGMIKKGKILEDNPDIYPDTSLGEKKLRIVKADLPLEIREKELKVHKNLENVIMRIRCQETTHIVLARIAVYWSGVLYSASKNNKNDDFKNMPMTYIDGNELLNQYFKDNEQWED